MFLVLSEFLKETGFKLILKWPVPLAGGFTWPLSFCLIFYFYFIQYKKVKRQYISLYIYCCKCEWAIIKYQNGGDWKWRNPGTLYSHTDDCNLSFLFLLIWTLQCINLLFTNMIVEYYLVFSTFRTCMIH